MHRSLLNGDQVQRIYLDELGNPDEQPIGVSLLQLTIAPEAQTATQARQLIERVQEEDTGILARNEIIEVIATIAVYKFAELSREEVEEMLGLKLEESRIYQELKEEVREECRQEGRQEMLAVTVPLLLETGMTIEQIAEQLKVNVEAVRRAAPGNS
jgi:predicted transposase/invertase (TIGR01784 family)